MRWRSRHSQPSSHQSVRSSYPGELADGHRHEPDLESGRARAEPRLLGRLAFRRIAAPPELSCGDAQEGARARIAVSQCPSGRDPFLERRGRILQRAGDGAHSPGIPEGAPQ